METLKKTNTKVKKIDLAWIVVSDLKKAKKFFTESVGLKIAQDSEEMGWIEFAGHDGGAALGVASANSKNPISAGQNAITTFTVDNIDTSKNDFLKKGVKLIGEVVEVPGHAKLQLFSDTDGNLFQIVECIHK